MERIINRGLPLSSCSFEVLKVEWRSPRVLYPPPPTKINYYAYQDSCTGILYTGGSYVHDHIYTQTHANLLIFSEIPYAVAPLYVTGNAFTGYVGCRGGWRLNEGWCENICSTSAGRRRREMLNRLRFWTKHDIIMYAVGIYHKRYTIVSVLWRGVRRRGGAFRLFVANVVAAAEGFSVEITPSHSLSLSHPSLSHPPPTSAQSCLHNVRAPSL